MSITQEKIARKLGVSQSSVSIVLNRKGNLLSPKTHDRILRTAEVMGYSKKRFSSLPGMKTGNVAFLVRGIDTYYARFLQGITHEAQRNGCTVTIYTMQQDSAMVADIIFHQRKLDGLILQELLSPDTVERLKRHLPVVLLNRRLPQVSIDSVMPDNAGGIEKAVRHLFSLGHRRIAFFGTTPLDLHGEERMRGYYDGLRSCELESAPSFVQLIPARTGSVEETEKIAGRVLATWRKLPERPTAAVAIGDVWALPLIKAAHRLGVSVPAEMSIVGFSNIYACVHSHPSLSSIEQPMEDMGKKAFSLLVERIQSPDRPIQQIILDTELICRESIGPAS